MIWFLWRSPSASQFGGAYAAVVFPKYLSRKIFT
jgi:hypothetical protein